MSHLMFYQFDTPEKHLKGSVETLKGMTCSTRVDPITVDRQEFGPKTVW